MARQNTIQISMTCQEATFWCWAAVTQSINAFAGMQTLSQAEVASRHVPPTDPIDDHPDATSECGGKPCAGKRNSPHRLSLVLTDCGHAVDAINIDRLNFQDVVDVIDDGKPLPLRIDITTGDGGGHFICIVGYLDDGQGNEFVQLLDPLVPGIGYGAATVRTLAFEDLADGSYSVNTDRGVPNFKYELR